MIDIVLVQPLRSNTWTECELDILRLNYPTMPWVELCALLPMRSRMAIKLKAIQLGIHKLIREPRGQDWRNKLRVARLGSHLSDKARANLSITFSGARNPNYGKPRSEEVKTKFRIANCGKRLSEETKDKIRSALIGRKRPEVGEKLRGRLISVEQRQNLRIIRLGPLNPFYGKHHSEATKEKLRNAQYLRKRIRVPNGIELRFISICEKHNLPFKYVGDGHVWIAGCNPDFIHTAQRKIAIEIFGDYWHTPLFLGKALSDRRTEQGRKRLFFKHGWKLIVIWESQFDLPNAEDRVVEHVKEVLSNGRCLFGSAS